METYKDEELKAPFSDQKEKEEGKKNKEYLKRVKL